MQGCGMNRISARIDRDQIIARNVLPCCRIHLGGDAVVLVRAHVGDVIRLDGTAQHVPCDQFARHKRHFGCVVHGLPVIDLCATRRSDRDGNGGDGQLARNRFQLDIGRDGFAALIPDLHVLHAQRSRARIGLAARQGIGDAVAFTALAPSNLDLGERELLCRERLPVVLLAAAGGGQRQRDALDLDAVAHKVKIVIFGSVRAAAVVKHDLEQLLGHAVCVRARIAGRRHALPVLIIGNRFVKGTLAKHHLMSLALKITHLTVDLLQIVGHGGFERVAVILLGDGVKADLQHALIHRQHTITRKAACIPIGGVHRLAKTLLVHNAVLDRVSARACIGQRALRAHDLNAVSRKQRAAHDADHVGYAVPVGAQRLCVVRFAQLLEREEQRCTLANRQRSVRDGQLIIFGHVLAVLRQNGVIHLVFNAARHLERRCLFDLDALPGGNAAAYDLVIRPGLLLAVIHQPHAILTLQVQLAGFDLQRAVRIGNIVIFGHVPAARQNTQLHAILLGALCDVRDAGFIVVHEIHALPGDQAAACDLVSVCILSGSRVFQGHVGRLDRYGSFFDHHAANVYLYIVIRGAILPCAVLHADRDSVFMSAHVGRDAVRRDIQPITAVQLALGDLIIGCACALPVVHLGDVDRLAVLDLVRNHHRDLLCLDLDRPLRKGQVVPCRDVVALSVANDDRGGIDMADGTAAPVIGKIGECRRIHAVPFCQRLLRDLPMLAEYGAFPVLKLCRSLTLW